MNAVLAELQGEAARYGVKLVADTTTPITADCDPGTLHVCLTHLVGSLLPAARSGSSVSMVTTLEAPVLKITVLTMPNTKAGRALPWPALEKELGEMTTTLANSGVQVRTESTATQLALIITVEGAHSTPAQSNLRTAVVVDDDVDCQEFLRAVLEPKGYRVVSVSDGFDALLAIERFKPEVVLTDVLMPNMSGIDLIARIKSSCPDLPVIVFSGYGESLQANIAGLPNRVLTKPMTREQVLSALAAVLG